MFLFQLTTESDEIAVLYTGDTRLEPSHVESILSDSLRSVKYLYIDTSCALSRMHFPSKQQSIDTLISFIRNKPDNSRFRIEFFHLGCEDILRGIAYHLSTKIFVHPRSRRATLYLKLLPDIVTLDPRESRIHCCGDWKGPGCSDCELLKDTGSPQFFFIRPTTMGFGSISRKPIRLDAELIRVSKKKDVVSFKCETNQSSFSFTACILRHLNFKILSSL